MRGDIGVTADLRAVAPMKAGCVSPPNDAVPYSPPPWDKAAGVTLVVPLQLPEVPFAL